ncbi:ATP-binding protein [Dehalogenimonas sp. THU2]|uniref:ATP-binding protein n=1 Tax=Dehalogenimonas sp. THU2 TaxID=3151121 RepID=UPI003218CF5C
MEHISEILIKAARTSTSKANTDVSSSDKATTTPSKPECSLCRGARFVHARTPEGTTDYTRTLPCRCVDITSDKDRLKRLIDYSQLGTLRSLTFDNLLQEGRHGSAQHQTVFKAAYKAAFTFAADPLGFLVFTGPSGSGKTHLAAAITNKRIETGHAVLYRSAPDLMDDLRAGFSTGAESPYADTFEQIKNTPLLVLDDLGIQSDTAWAREKLDQLITYRFKQELPTVLVTAAPLEALDERLRNRIADPRLATVVRLAGQDVGGCEWPERLALQKRMTFSSFDSDRLNLPPEERENLSRAYQVAHDFARSPEGWLILQGVTGCGKTHLASSIINFRYQAGLPALFVVVPEFLDHLRSTFSPDSKISYDEMFDRVKTTPFLVLDDFGEQASTPWAHEKLYQVISYRYNAQLPTVVTTRASLDEIEPAISSRFIDHQFSMVFNVTAPDYRGDASHNKSRRTRTPRSPYKK